MAEYNPRKDRHKPTSSSTKAPLDALLGPELTDSEGEPVATSTSPTSTPALDASALDDRWPLERPHVTPQPSALPQRIPQIVWIAAGIGMVSGMLASIWIWSKLRSYLKR